MQRHEGMRKPDENGRRCVAHRLSARSNLTNATILGFAARATVALDFLELDRAWAPDCRRQPALTFWFGLGLSQDLGHELLPVLTDSLALEIELLLLVPDVLDVRDMADLVAVLQHNLNNGAGAASQNARRGRRGT